MRPLIDFSSPTLPFTWMRSGQPRALHRFLLVRSIVAAIVFLGCVPEAQYEEARSAADVAREAQRRAEARIAELEAELARIEKEHAEARDRLGRFDEAVSQAALERTHLEKQRDEHAELVTTLRGELARVGDHLRMYSESRDELSERLELAQGELERLTAELAALRAQSALDEGSDGAVGGPSAADMPSTDTSAVEPPPPGSTRAGNDSASGGE